MKDLGILIHVIEEFVRAKFFQILVFRKETDVVRALSGKANTGPEKNIQEKAGELSDLVLFCLIQYL